MRLPESVLALAASQSGVLSRDQLLGSGVSSETLRWRIGRDWRLLLPGVYVLQTRLPSPEQRLVAAQLVAGEDSWLAGTTAAALHGLRSCRLAVPIRLLVPKPRRSRRVAWVDARGRRGSVRLRRLLDEAADGAWSVPESDLLALIRTSRSLPEPMVNPLLTGPGGTQLTSPDLWFDDIGMAVLVQSREFHSDGLDWDATVVAG